MRIHQTPLALLLAFAYSLTSDAIADGNWRGSYSTGDQCFCSGELPSSVASRIVPTPVGGQTVRQVCARVGQGPGLVLHDGLFNYPVYKDPQCGHGPHTAASLAQAPDCMGSMDGTDKHCQSKGPSWALKQIYSTAPKIAAALPDRSEIAPRKEALTNEVVSVSNSSSDSATTLKQTASANNQSRDAVLSAFSGKRVVLGNDRFLQAREGIPANDGASGSRIIVDGIVYLKEDKNLLLSDLYQVDIESKKESVRAVVKQPSPNSQMNMALAGKPADEASRKANSLVQQKIEKERQESEARAQFKIEQDARKARLDKEAELAKKKELAAKKKLAEQRKLAKEKRLAKDKKLANDRKIAKANRLARDKKLAAEKKLAKERKLAKEKNLAIARKLAENRKQSTQKNLAENQISIEEKKRAAQKRFVEQQRLAREAKLARQKNQSGKDVATIDNAKTTMQADVQAISASASASAPAPASEKKALVAASGQVKTPAEQPPAVADSAVSSALRLPKDVRASSRNFDYFEAMPANYDIGGNGFMLEGSGQSGSRFQYLGKLGVSDLYREIMIGGGLFVTPAKATRMTVVLLAGVENGSFELSDEERAPGRTIIAADTGVYVGAMSRFVVNSRIEVKAGLGYSSFFEGDVTLYGGGYFHVTARLDFMSRFEIGDNDSFGLGIRYYY